MPLREVVCTDDRALQDIADALARSHKQLIVTGAGISTSCGIPDFRSKDGLYNLSPARVVLPPTPPPSNPTTPSSRKRKAYTTDDEDALIPPSSQSSIFQASNLRSSPTSKMRGEDLFNARVFQSAESTTMFYQFIATLRQKIHEEVKNTSHTHKLIRALRDGGRLMRCYTQNIDGLEARDGLCMDLKRGKGNKRRFMKKHYEVPPPKDTTNTDFDPGCQVVQLHGELSNLRCRVCATETDWTESDTEIFLEGAAPKCEQCDAKSEERIATGKRGLTVGEMRPNIVLYGEDHPQNAAIMPIIQYDAASQPDVLVIMGTSLKVHGLQKVVRDFAKAVHAQKNGRVVFVNRTKPSESVWEGIIDEYVAMDCDEWVMDLKSRRPDIWLRQGDLDLKVTKEVVNKKRKSDALDKENVVSRPPTKKQKVEVRIPVLKNTQGKAMTSNPATNKLSGWNLPRQAINSPTSRFLSPRVQVRPDIEPLTREKDTIWKLKREALGLRSSPAKPDYSPLSFASDTPQGRSGRFRDANTPTTAVVAKTPTPRQNMKISAKSGVTGSGSPWQSSRLVKAVSAADEELDKENTKQDPGVGEKEDEGTLQRSEHEAKRQLSFVSASIAGEVEKPLTRTSYASKLVSLLGAIAKPVR